MNWQLKLGSFFFKHRTLTPIPLIILVLVIFRPIDLGTTNLLVNLSGLVIGFLGQAIRIWAVGYSFPGTSGRESYLRADHLNTTGIYSLVRNPLYIGNFLFLSGVVIIFSNLWALLFFALFLIIQYYLIILAEESFLKEKYGRHYEDYCRRVYRILPGFSNYRQNQNPFNLRKVIFKEKDSLFNMLVMMLLLVAYKEKFFTGRLASPVIFIVPGVLLIIVYIVVIILKKRSPEYRITSLEARVKKKKEN